MTTRLRRVLTIAAALMLAVVMPVDAPTIRAWDAFTRYVAGFPDTDITEMEVTIERIEGRNDLAYVWGTYIESYKTAGMHEAVSIAGKFLWIVRSRASGGPAAVPG